MSITRFSPSNQGGRSLSDSPAEGMKFDEEGRYVSYAMHRALYEKMEGRAIAAEKKARVWQDRCEKTVVEYNELRAFVDEAQGQEPDSWRVTADIFCGTHTADRETGEFWMQSGNAYPLYALPQIPAKQDAPKDIYSGHGSLADMVSTHLHVWRGALQDAMENESEKSFIEHELKALDDIEAAVKYELQSHPEPNQESVLDKPARVGGTIFNAGIKERLAIECAQKHYEAFPPKEITGDALCFHNTGEGSRKHYVTGDPQSVEISGGCELLKEIKKRFVPIELYAVFEEYLSEQSSPNKADVQTGLNIAADYLEKTARDYAQEHGHQEPDTGAWVFPGNGQDYLYWCEENAEVIRSLPPLKDEHQ